LAFNFLNRFRSRLFQFGFECISTEEWKAILEFQLLFLNSKDLPVHRYHLFVFIK